MNNIELNEIAINLQDSINTITALNEEHTSLYCSVDALSKFVPLFNPIVESSIITAASESMGLNYKEEQTGLFKRMWIRIKDTFWKIFNIVSDFFSRFTGGSARIRAKIETLITALGRLPDVDRGVHIRNSHVLSYNGSLQSNAIHRGIDELSDTVTNIYNYIDVVVTETETAAKHPEQAIDTKKAEVEMTATMLYRMQHEKAQLIKHMEIIGGYKIHSFRESTLGGLPVIELRKEATPAEAVVTIRRSELSTMLVRALHLLTVIERQKAVVAKSEMAFKLAFSIVEGALGLDSSRGIILRNVSRVIIGTRMRKEFGNGNTLLMRTSVIAFSVSRALCGLAINYLGDKDDQYKQPA